MDNKEISYIKYLHKRNKNSFVINENGKLILYKKCLICGRIYKYGEKCPNYFCQKHNIQQFRSLIKYFGFNKEKLGILDVEKEFYKIRNILYDLYWNKHLSSSEIAKIYNYPSTTNIIQKIFTYLEIPHKNNKYATKENYLKGNLGNKEIKNQYHSRWHITWNNKKVYLRSSYELDYAKELDKKYIDYDVEKLRIKYWDSMKKEYRIAIPDFYIQKENLIVEIKSNYTLNIQEMKDKKKAYLNLGYNFKLICDYKELNI